MLEKVQKFGEKFKLMLEAKVVKVEQEDDKVLLIMVMFGDASYHHHLNHDHDHDQVRLTFSRPRLTSTVEGDKAIITPPTTAQRTIQVFQIPYC